MHTGMSLRSVKVLLCGLRACHSRRSEMGGRGDDGGPVPEYDDGLGREKRSSRGLASGRR